jgi:hypothetical protein
MKSGVDGVTRTVGHLHSPSVFMALSPVGFGVPCPCHLDGCPAVVIIAQSPGRSEAKSLVDRRRGGSIVRGDCTPKPMVAHGGVSAGRRWCVLTAADRVIQWSTALAVLGVAGVAAVASYAHAHDLVRAHGEAGWTARLVPVTVDGLIYAGSMVMLDSAPQDAGSPACAVAARPGYRGDARGQRGARLGPWPGRRGGWPRGPRLRWSARTSCS